MAESLKVSTERLKQIVHLTERVEAVIRRARVKDGLCALFLSHTTAALTTGEIGEGTDPISSGKLVLGTWQSIMLVELDGPREREVHVTIHPSP